MQRLPLSMFQFSVFGMIFQKNSDPGGPSYRRSHQLLYMILEGKRKNKLDLFEERLSDRYALLVEIGYLTDPKADTCMNCENIVCKILLVKDYCHACSSNI
jgi:hypothetical protein